MREGTGPLAAARLTLARACIARAVLPPPHLTSLGDITLRDDQAALAGVVARKLRDDRGCLLAADVGRGKTFIALAAARDSSSALVVAPASLRSMWSAAMERAQVRCDFTTHESLSRRFAGRGDYDLVIVDESHRFRNPRTIRYAALVQLCAFPRVLLLSATPVQNRRDDLATQLALFLGARAFGDLDQLAQRHVVRGSADDDGLPRLVPPVTLDVSCNDHDVLEALLALPAPPRPADGGDAGLLRSISLVRAWSSSRAALLQIIATRRRTVAAIEQSLRDGCIPSRRDLRAWAGGGGDIQLTLASLLVDPVPASSDVARLGVMVAAEHSALERLAALLAGSGDPDVARAGLLARLRAQHPGASIVAFTEWATTARRYFHLLRHEPMVGLLTASSACIASGRLSRSELLDRFAPRARGAPAPSLRERVTLLIATDLLSEGVNLQDASVVVHLDLPWNPQRMTQRVGRLRRPGGAPEVHSFVVAPPADAELLLDVQRRLRTKLHHAEQLLGRGIPVLPTLVHDEPLCAPAPAEIAARRAVALDQWRCRDPARLTDMHAACVVAACRAEATGWLACSHDGSLVACIDGSVSDAPDFLLRAIAMAQGSARAVMHAERRCAQEAVREWTERTATRDALGITTPATSLQRAVDRCIRLALALGARSERVCAARAARHIRDVLAAPLPLGIERAMLLVLAQARSSSDHAATLHALSALCTPLPHGSSAVARTARELSPLALILFG